MAWKLIYSTVEWISNKEQTLAAPSLPSILALSLSKVTLRTSPPLPFSLSLSLSEGGICSFKAAEINRGRFGFNHVLQFQLMYAF
ncbi:hypothetical protein GQ457_02G013580 [Hibiscus cannabinus]